MIELEQHGINDLHDTINIEPECGVYTAPYFNDTVASLFTNRRDVAHVRFTSKCVLACFTEPEIDIGVDIHLSFHGKMLCKKVLETTECEGPCTMCPLSHFKGDCEKVAQELLNRFAIKRPTEE